MSWDPRALPDLTGRTVAVTGGNAGIGYFICEQLAAAGADVVILGRDPGRVATAVRSITSRTPDARVTSIPLDLVDPESVEAAAAALNRLDRLDALIHNAGLTQPGKRRETTRQGVEVALATNHLGHFALTALAMPALSATPGSRIVPIGSAITRMIGFDLDDLGSERSYGRQRAYAQSKHAVQVFGFELDRRLRAAGADIRSVVAHPGFGLDGASPRRERIEEPSALSRLTALLLAPISHGNDRAAWPAVRAAVDPDAEGGQYYGPARGGAGDPVPGRPPRSALDPGLGARLWTMSEELSGVEFRVPAARA
ncbi:SDR family NAD(P)-dependent oxidoreductase [Microbispora sp. RL4-1S]|uniref:SDR family NAD(P)-dependent oxidoreductase n=1 Tax=Microbispora oryzae TaxID=2806554 RepID=A0A941AI55_9ACTN|nr:SDR family NAD(P)-dependent oxidoreductase [Microbispora oryzae]